ncbi:MAG TPA: lysophospholipid acyltransferase family protein [Gammaproteobacteria bacterium]|nr:lysophospholipid acyltransferase family protein [Gammaproteobacteria bacterium]
MAALRAALFYLGMTLSLIAVTPLFPLVLPLPFPARFRVLSTWARFNLWWLRVTCGVHWQVEGLDNLPRAGGAVVLAKHQSTWETLGLQRILPPHTWVLKRELLRIPLFGWGLAVLRAIAIDRKAGRRALQQVVEQGNERLEAGIWVVVFPEGTRTAPGSRQEYNVGGAMLATKTGFPVVPIAHNAGEFWPKQGWRKRPGTITVVIGPVIPAAGRKAGEVNAEAEAWIESKSSEISGL